MRVVHIAKSDSAGGADRSALNLHKGLIEQGIDSVMLVQNSLNSLPSVTQAGGLDASWMPKIDSLLIWGNRATDWNTHYSLNLPGSMNLEHNQLLRSADVINLHWVSGSLSASSICTLASLGKPMVWTLHDARPLTGGCHFPSDCTNYQSSCTDCPQLLWNCGGMIEEGRHFMERAIRFANMHFVAPSSWMRSIVDSATTAKGCSVSTIPYGVDADLFTPGDSESARVKLGLDKEAFYILLASHHVEERRKGFPEARAILQSMQEISSLKNMIKSGAIRILVCGQTKEEIKLPGWLVEHAGYLSMNAMPQLYNASNLLLFTSVQDNLPNVVMEAMACGTPVVAHDLPGIRDLLGEDGFCGKIIPIGLPNNSATIIKSLIDNEHYRKQLGENLRNRILEKFQISNQALDYIKLYESIMPTERPRLEDLRVEPNEEITSIIACLIQRAGELTLTEILLERDCLKTKHEQKKERLKLLEKNTWIQIGKMLHLVK